MSEKANEAAKSVEVLCARLEALQEQMLEGEVARKRVIEAAYGARERLQMLADEVRGRHGPDSDPAEVEGEGMRPWDDPLADHPDGRLDDADGRDFAADHG